jgi:hypothetical protein
VSYLDNPEPGRRLKVEMDLIARNITFLARRYRLLPQGRSTLVIADQVTDLVLGSSRWATIPYRQQVMGCPFMRSRSRTPGLTPATAADIHEIEMSDPWAFQSGISTASDAMVTWILTEELRGRKVTYDAEASMLVSGSTARPTDTFVPEGIGAHCYPTESYFAQDVCTYLSRWWVIRQEVDGLLDGGEVRIDAVLESRTDPDLLIGVEFKNPQGHINALRGLTQAAKYRKAAWEGYGRIPIAYCCPGKVPAGREADYVLKKLRIGLLDFESQWSLVMPDFSWSENAGIRGRETS